MPCSSHTTARSASLPTSRGRAARRGKPMPPYSPQVRAYTVRLYQDGLSCRAVAERVKAEGRASPHYVTILRWAQDAGKGRKLHGHRLRVSGEIVQGLYEKGTPVSEIAQRFHVGIATVYKRLHEAGTKMRPSRIRYGHVLTERSLRDLYLKKTVRAEDIAAKFGCNVGTVYNWLRRNGVPLKGPRRSTRPNPTGRQRVVDLYLRRQI